MQWLAAGFLPLPALLAIGPAESAELSCVYLALASAWLATEVFFRDGLPASRGDWVNRMLSLSMMLLLNASVVIALGLAVNVRSHLPFAAMASISVLPSIGLVPWFSMRLRQQYLAIIFSTIVIVSAKLAGCVVTRIVYGADYIEMGYVSDDWRTAKLMISCFWLLTLLTTTVALASGYMRARAIKL